MFEPEELGQRKDELATSLREARKRSGLTGDRLADRCGISQSKISKIETGKILPSATDVERILSALGATEKHRRQLVALAKLANTEFQGVRSSLKRGLHQKQRELAALEAGSKHIRFFLPLMITGLLQTPEYARASLASFPGDHPQAVVKRLERQAALYEGTRQFSFLLTEAAIRWQLCPPPVMAVQIGRLISLLELPNIRLGVISLDRHIPDGPLNTFTIYDERLAAAETFGGVIVMRDPRDVSYHLQLFYFFEQYAVFNTEARALLSSYAEDFRAADLSSRLFHDSNNLVTGIGLYGLCLLVIVPNMATHGTSINWPIASSGNTTLSELRREFGDRWHIVPIDGGYRAVPCDTGGHTLIPRYGRTPAELAESIRFAEPRP